MLSSGFEQITPVSGCFTVLLIIRRYTECLLCSSTSKWFSQMWQLWRHPNAFTLSDYNIFYKFVATGTRIYIYIYILTQKYNVTINDGLVTQSKERQFIDGTYNFLQNSIKLGFYKYSIIYQDMPTLTRKTMTFTNVYIILIKFLINCFYASDNIDVWH